MGSKEPSKQLVPGQIVFFQANGEEAAPGWYEVVSFDHEHTREFGEDGWWWVCRRMVDGLMQTICESSEYLIVDCDSPPHKVPLTYKGAKHG